MNISNELNNILGIHNEYKNTLENSLEYISHI